MFNPKSIQKIIIIGGGGHAKSVISILKKIPEFKIVGYVDLENKGKVLGISYLGTDQILKKLSKDHDCHAAVMGVGSVGISSKRNELMSRIEAWGFHFPVVVSPSAIVNEDVKIGHGTVILDRAVVSSGVRIGKGVIINTGAVLDHDCRIGNFVHVAPGAVLSGTVRIGDGAHIGTGAKLIQEVTVGKNCLIAAGAVVVKDCRKQGTYMGLPARLVIS